MQLLRHNISPDPEDFGGGESWEQSSDDKSLGYSEDINPSYGYYSAAGSDQFAVQRASRNWGNLADEPPFQSWEEKADAEFTAAIANNANEECCIQLEQYNTLDQHFPPLAVTAASPSCTSVSPIHIPTPKSGPVRSVVQSPLIYRDTNLQLNWPTRTSSSCGTE
ncbi:hypothetical protein LguiA_007503 [Lonicera macranthoides]